MHKLFLVLILTPSAAAAATPSEEASAPVTLRTETVVRLFERALLPGSGGAPVPTETLAPAYQFVSLRSERLRAPWGGDDVDVELAAWGNVTVGGTNDPWDGELTSASIRQRLGPAYLRLGRQSVAGGAARFARFDGASAGITSEAGVGADAYAGWSVLSRYDRSVGVQYRSVDSALLREPAVNEPLERGGYWVAGGRAHYGWAGVFDAGLSFHEQAEAGELGRRSVGADAVWDIVSSVRAGAFGVLETDAGSVSDARAWVEVDALPGLSATGEALHTVPALMLSRQSVLSVFSDSDFDEVGGEVRYDPWTRLGGAVSGYTQLTSSGQPVRRMRVLVRGHPDAARRLMLLGEYGRVHAPDNGYSLARLGARADVAAGVSISGEQYAYFYERAVRGVSHSLLQTANVEVRPIATVRVLLGGSVLNSPYARADAQALLRVIFEPGLTGGGS